VEIDVLSEIINFQAKIRQRFHANESAMRMPSNGRSTNWAMTALPLAADEPGRWASALVAGLGCLP